MLQVYWMVGQEGKVPPVWPDSLSTKINLKNPMKFTFMDNKYKTFIAVSDYIFVSIDNWKKRGL